VLTADQMRRRYRPAWDTVGGLSAPSKMPCFSYSIPASACVTGSKLRKVKGSTCEGCYAYKGNYVRPNVKNALQRRLDAIYGPAWVESMATLINGTESDWFRHFDSGDLQSVEHLARICEVARLTPTVTHWLPTREYAMVKEYRASNTVPSNLTIRLSAHMVNGPAPIGFGLPASGVHTEPTTAHECPATRPESDHKCNECRACWNPSVNVVSYIKH
jgi:hypothetical protein